MDENEDGQQRPSLVTDQQQQHQPPQGSQLLSKLMPPPPSLPPTSIHLPKTAPRTNRSPKKCQSGLPQGPLKSLTSLQKQQQKRQESQTVRKAILPRFKPLTGMKLSQLPVNTFLRHKLSPSGIPLGPGRCTPSRQQQEQWEQTWQQQWLEQWQLRWQWLQWRCELKQKQHQQNQQEKEDNPMLMQMLVSEEDSDDQSQSTPPLSQVLDKLDSSTQAEVSVTEESEAFAEAVSKLFVPRYRCNWCQKTFRKSGALKQHVNCDHSAEVSSNDSVRVCKSCGAPFKSLEKMTEHLKEFSNPNYAVPSLPCIVCPLQFYRRSEQYDHVKTHEHFTDDHDNPTFFKSLIETFIKCRQKQHEADEDPDDDDDDDDEANIQDVTTAL